MAGKIFKYLPKSTSFSIPTSNNTNVHRANFSGPIVSIIPKEARRSKRNDDRNNNGFVEAQEPTSPKVTCIGQVKKHKKHEKKNKKKVEKEGVESKKLGILRGMFQKKVRVGRPPVAEATTESEPMMRKCVTGRERSVEVVPEVGTMRKFASGRETLADFDWRKFSVEEEEEEEEGVESKKSGIQGMFQKKMRLGRPLVAEATMESEPMMRKCASGREKSAEVVPEVGMMRKFASGRETLADFDWRKFAIEEEEEEAIIAHSEPLVMGGGREVEKEEEVNLWKRRTLAQPEPLQLKQALVFK